MRLRHILTGAPGSGKTTILAALRDRGHHVVDEAATDIIHAFHARGVQEPWRRADFPDQIVALQRHRQVAADRHAGGLTVFDRSPVCTLALTVYLRCPVSAALAAELDRIARENTYNRCVFFVHNIGFVEPTAARRISYAESLAFERVHLDVYRELGYEIVDVNPGPVADRVALIEDVIGTAPLTRSPARGCPAPTPGTGR